MQFMYLHKIFYRKEKPTNLNWKERVRKFYFIHIIKLIIAGINYKLMNIMDTIHVNSSNLTYKCFHDELIIKIICISKNILNSKSTFSSCLLITKIANIHHWNDEYNKWDSL